MDPEELVAPLGPSKAPLREGVAIAEGVLLGGVGVCRGGAAATAGCGMGAGGTTVGGTGAAGVAVSIGTPKGFWHDGHCTTLPPAFSGTCIEIVQCGQRRTKAIRFP